MSARSDGRILGNVFGEGCRQCGLNPDDGPIVVGVSGGCDSMVLAHLLHEAGFDLVVVHINHGIRPGAAADEVFVKAWCERRNVVFKAFQPHEDAPSSGVQAWARHMRYTFFLKAAQEVNAHNVAVAHHADDQFETILINLNRGTGLAGLAGMRARRPLFTDQSVQLVRPLLAVSRADIEQEAVRRGWDWVEDPSNQDASYTRNAIRREINDMESAARNAFRPAGLTVAARIGGAREIILRILDEIASKHGALLPFEDIDDLPHIWREWVIMEWAFLHAPLLPRRSSQVREIMALRTAQVGRQARFESGTVWRERTGLRMAPGTDWLRPEAVSLPVPRPGESCRVPFGEGLLVVECAERAEPASGHDPGKESESVQVDASKIGSSLTIRLWEAGDRFQPLGMEGTKKVKSHLTDRRVAPSQRERVPVVLSNDRIVWVAGFAIDNHVRVVDATQVRLRMHWIESRMPLDRV